MGKKKASDNQGMSLEMFLHGGAAVASQLANLFNGILGTGEIPETWHESWLTLLPKSGDLNDPANWRPIALLSISYKILARAVYERLKKNLEQQQAEDQYGFRPGRSTSQALLALESIIGKAIEWNVEIWIISLDVRKAFDRVEQSGLFHSLLEQGVPHGYVVLLKRLYDRQEGILNENTRFPIGRGVRQGDVLSPLLFNACLEQAIRKWKARLTSQGVALEPRASAEKLTNLRYADDLLLVGKSLQEVTDMLELLVETLKDYGLDLHPDKTVILSTAPPPEAPTFHETNVGLLKVLHRSGSHKYLGRRFGGDLRRRATDALEHRIGLAWAKFQNLAHTLTNKHVSIKLRMRLFQAVVTPTALYALDSAPLTKALLDKLDATQRCMMRRMVGWICYGNDSWEERGHRMKIRLQKALELYPVEKWSAQWAMRRQGLKDKMPTAPLWTRAAYEWNPVACAPYNTQYPYRSAGRPRVQW